mmetsp:Transcript_116969/g.338105  ORF Transcript_116969/g.338105 Transcript_116969/m.338105 type:complete len:421 (-) Transcript_116969:180-1442(-)
MARQTILVALSFWCVAAAANQQAEDEHFRSFVREHGRDYVAGSEEFERRFALFQQRRAEVRAHNAKVGRTWTAAINGLADRTPAELAALRGYVHGASVGPRATSAGLGLAAVSARVVDAASLPKDFTWQHELNAMKDVLNQGSCGSCWAVSSATVLRAHAQLYQTDRKFSAQQLVDCVPNPKQCGGSGGCKGATAELAMEYAAKRGLVSEEEREYTAMEASCPSALQLTEAVSFLASRGSGGAALRAEADGSVAVVGGEGAKFGLIGWRKLPGNKAEPLLEALYSSGPVVVSVAATAAWGMYSSGVFNDCQPGAVINHAVVLTGYGSDGGSKYWQIQNSWGAMWGEAGFVRLIRRDAKEEDAFCGWDNSPEEGTACVGGPKKVWVCGSCGVLYDSVVPTFRLSPEGWWHQRGNRSLAAAA